MTHGYGAETHERAGVQRALGTAEASRERSFVVSPPLHLSDDGGFWNMEYSMEQLALHVLTNSKAFRTLNEQTSKHAVSAQQCPDLVQGTVTGMHNVLTG